MLISQTHAAPSNAAPTPGSQPRPEKPVFDMTEIRSELARQYEAWKELPEDQKLRHLKLEKHDLSEQDLNNLPADERAQFEQKIAEATNRPLLIGAEPDLKTGNSLFRPVLSLASVLAVAEPEATAQETKSETPLLTAG